MAHKMIEKTLKYRRMYILSVADQQTYNGKRVKDYGMNFGDWIEWRYWQIFLYWNCSVRLEWRKKNPDRGYADLKISLNCWSNKSHASHMFTLRSLYINIQSLCFNLIVNSLSFYSTLLQDIFASLGQNSTWTALKEHKHRSSHCWIFYCYSPLSTRRAWSDRFVIPVTGIYMFARNCRNNLDLFQNKTLETLGISIYSTCSKGNGTLRSRYPRRLKTWS